MCLIARHFESRQVPTLILGSALDILKAGKPPRAQFLNFPLGFEAGNPDDPDNQQEILRTALQAFDTMRSPGVQHLPFTWPEGWAMIRERESQSAGTDTRSTRDTTPRYQTNEDRLLAEAGRSPQSPT